MYVYIYIYIFIYIYIYIYIDLIACSNFSEVIKFETTDYPKRSINVVIR